MLKKACVVVVVIFLENLFGLLPVLLATENLETLPAEVLQAQQQIEPDRVLNIAKILSDNDFEGREAGSEGARLAGMYIAKEFRSAKLLPGGNAGSYFRNFKISFGYKIASHLRVIGPKDQIEDLQRAEDYMPIHLVERKASVQAESVLVGYGITAPEIGFDEYQNLEVEGKIVILFSGVPWQDKGEKWQLAKDKAYHYGTLEYKVRNAEKHGAVGVMIMDPPHEWRRDLQVKEKLRVLDLTFPLPCQIPVIHITKSAVAKMALLSDLELYHLARDIRQDRTAQSMPLSNRTIEFQAQVAGEAWVGRNVIGVLPGRDPKLKHEAVVIGAHYDHLGELGAVNKIYNGANDNASGVSALIEIAKAYSRLSQPPKRTVIFIAFDAEEIGRIGSESYVKYPLIPCSQTVLMINFDMIGRNEGNHIFAVGTTSSRELHEIHQQVNQHIGLVIDHPESYRLGRSDHTAFYYQQIPIMYLFGGLDIDYHSIRDSWEKLLPGKIAKVAQLAFLTSWQVAERDERIHFSARQE